MKKNNLFVTFIFICLAVAVAFCSSCGTVAQATLQLQAATTETKKLFNENTGAYNVTRYDIKQGAVFNFFGYDWRVVAVNEDKAVATFWMVTPYTTTYFNKTATSGADQNKNNTWSNGYTSATWNGEDLGESNIRKFLFEEAAKIIDNAKYKTYKNKVVAGYVAGSNYNNDDCNYNDLDAYYNRMGSNPDGDGEHYCLDDQTKKVSVSFALNENDRLWLPSYSEIKDGGTWNLNNEQRNWDITNNGSFAWLRSVFPYDNEHPEAAYNFKAATVGYRSNTTVGNNAESVFGFDVDQELGVRPAIHLNIEAAGKTVGGDPNGSWFNDDLMKTLFIVICVLGILGIILVVTAVIVKARNRKKEQGA